MDYYLTAENLKAVCAKSLTLNWDVLVTSTDIIVCSKKEPGVKPIQVDHYLLAENLKAV